MNHESNEKGSKRGYPSITIKINDKPCLPKCEFLCDVPLADKLNDYELTQFMNCHSTNLFIGKPKSGKTSLLYSFFKSKKLFKKVFHNIYVFQPSRSRQSMSDKLFDTLPADQLYEELDFDTLNEVIIKCKESDPKENNCILFDDMGAYLKDVEILKLLKEMIMNRRHLHISCFFLSQTYKSVPKEIRKLFSNVFLFRVSKHELEDVFSELIEQRKDDVLAISKLVFDKPFQYLFINTDTQRLFKGFDEIIIE
jgi:hypothetical protein